MRVRALAEGKPMFMLELAYAALVHLTNAPEDAVQPMLMIQTPFMLYPFARRIMADMVRDGGMPPLMIEPIDFAALYQVKQRQAAQARTTGRIGLSFRRAHARFQIASSPSSFWTKARCRAISSTEMRGSSLCGRWCARTASGSAPAVTISTGASASPRCRPPISSR